MMPARPKAEVDLGGEWSVENRSRAEAALLLADSASTVADVSETREASRLATIDVPAWAVFLVFAAIYLLTASHGSAPSVDPETNAMSAFVWANRATPVAEEYREIVKHPKSPGRITWFVSSPVGPVSQYPPGAAMFAVPMYLLADEDTNPHLELSRYVDGLDETLVLPDIWPSATVAAIASALAMAALYAVFREIGIDTITSLSAIAILGLGTAVWTVAADSLWQHGPAIMLIALTMLAGLRQRSLAVLILSFMLVLVRPPVVLIAVPISVGLSRRSGDARVGSASLGGTALGVGALAAYNKAVFGEWSISGGYSDVFASNVLSPDLGSFLGNLYGALFSAERGVAIWSPFVVVGLVALPWVWRRLESWMVWSLAGAGAYVVVQYLANRYSGGSGFSYYRYPLEPMIAAAPAGALALKRVFTSPVPANRFMLQLLIAWSLVVHMIAATGLR